MPVRVGWYIRSVRVFFLSIFVIITIQVATAPGFHLFPFRTEKLSPVTPMVLRNSGRVGRRRFFSGSPPQRCCCGGLCFCPCPLSLSIFIFIPTNLSAFFLFSSQSASSPSHAVLPYTLIKCFLTHSRSVSSHPHEVLRHTLIQCFLASSYSAFLR